MGEDPNKTAKNKVSGANTKQGESSTFNPNDSSKNPLLGAGSTKHFDVSVFGKKGGAKNLEALPPKIGSGSVKDIEKEIDRDYDRLAKP